MTADHAISKTSVKRRSRPRSTTDTKARSRLPERELLEVGCVTQQTRPLNDTLRERIIGQEDALEALTCAFSRVLSGLRDPSRPALTVLLLGPTGVGKTETAKALAQTLFRSEKGLTRVNSEEYAHGHELAKLLGAPPGYVGHNVEPLLSQRRIDAHHRQAVIERNGMVGEDFMRNEASVSAERGNELSIILFDEIEKAHPVLWNAMLGILEGGTLTLGDNSTTDFTQSIIIMTSNVGSREMNALLEKPALGFRSVDGSQEKGRDLTKTVLTAARKKFPIEFLNRFDEILVYSPLERQHLELIFDKFLAEIHGRAINQAGVPLLIKVRPEAKNRILERGTDVSLGARPLRRAMETELVDPLSRLIASHRVNPGDIVEIELEEDRLVFYRHPTTEPVLLV